MKNLMVCILFIYGSVFGQNAEIWLTDASKSIIFQKQNQIKSFENKKDLLPTIFVDDTKKFQTMDGFGFTLTGGSASLINQLKTKSELLQELFGTSQKDVGFSYLRVSVGASDLSDHVFSYSDKRLSEFDISEEKKDLIPILKEILKINPKIKILASPWSPPIWMKTNNSSIGGSLKTEYYLAYAQYLRKYIKEMGKNNIKIDAITIQNEPLNPDNNPSLLMLASEQQLFIAKYLGPEFKRYNISTKIIIYDHNADRTDYPIEILNDPTARKYIDGSAFHLYGGNINALSEVHQAHPDKNLYFTEQWIGSPSNFSGDFLWHIKNIVIGSARNWSKTILEWNLAADASQNPHTDGGCKNCLGALTIDNQNISRNAAYYILAHVSKFVRPNSVRVSSNQPLSLNNVAFKTPKGKTVLLVQNESNDSLDFYISYHKKNLKSNLGPKAVATYIW